MIHRTSLLAFGAALCALLVPSSASAAPSAAWKLSAFPAPNNVAPGQKAEYVLLAINVGGADTGSAPSELQLTLPPEIVPLAVETFNSDFRKAEDPACTLEPELLSCETSELVGPGRSLRVALRFEVPAATPEGEALQADATVSGGGAPQQATSTATALVSSTPLPFGFTLPLAAPAVGPDGAAATLAGSHPYQQNVGFGFPVRPGTNGVRDNSGHPHEIRTELPRGMIVDPSATPLLCTEAELLSQASGEGCPDSSQVGLIDFTTNLIGQDITFEDRLYNMVPPPGRPAALGFDAAGAPVPAHILGAVRTESDFGIEAIAPDILSFAQTTLFDIHAQLWGDPSGHEHDEVRGACAGIGGACPVEAQKTAMLTMPGDCPGRPLHFEAAADTWEQPGLFHSSTYESADLEGNPVSIGGCNQLSYEPTISSQPTTNLADSPSGLDFDLHQPQEAPHLEPLSGRASGELKDAKVTLPQGMVVNPSQADGLDACSETQIGFLAETEGVHFSKQPQSCPDASKLGTLEAASPLLAEYEDTAAGAGTKRATDPETGAPIPRPLRGSVYLAKPFENPFGTLLAIYFAIEDERSGIVAKLAGKVEPDPNTGQLTAVFEENPELPLEDIKLHLYGGARGSLITPISCGSHSTTSTLTPWSAPEGLDAHPSDSFPTTAEPGGGSCPSSEGSAQNKPTFSAGTLAPQAGAFSPFVLKLSREDGSQRIAGIDTLLPPGLSGKLAGIAQCSEAQIAQAKSREKPNLGALEKANPSCPASTQVGVVDIAAGAGPTPFHTQGKVYLAGPYKGAPLSLAVIVPAVAGPFDLGAVVSRVALHVEPESAQIHAVSDPLPQIIDGIPLDLRSIALSMDRSQFTLNPTSCEPMQITGSATSALGGSAALTNPFQVGGCPQLPFKPKLSLKLKGGTKRTGHPKLIANLKAKPGEANVAKAQVKLPPSAFLDQAHIRTVCTRVQFAANACPAGSIYGKASATTPLLAYPLSGNVYLRSSNHKLPDLVVALKGPDYQPIEIDLDGKTDSVKGSLRNTFEAVPDAPVSSFRLELFGGKRGLVVNSRNLCAHTYKAEVNLTGQNGKVYDTEPVVGTGCGKAGKKQSGRHGHPRSK
jgi:hypothetical protein